MGQGELGRYCQQKIGWLISKVWPFQGREAKKYKAAGGGYK